MRVVARRNLENEKSQGLFEYLSTKRKDIFEYVLLGKASTTSIDSPQQFIYVYDYSLPKDYWWTDNYENSYIEFHCLANFAIKISNYSFVTHGSETKYTYLGLVDWTIEYIFKTKTIFIESFHSDGTHVPDTLFHFPAAHNKDCIIITGFKLTMIGPNSRKGVNYNIALRRFDIYGTLYEYYSTCSNHINNTHIFLYMILILCCLNI